MEALAARSRGGNSCKGTGELVLVSLESRTLDEDALDGEYDRASDIGACGKGRTSAHDRLEARRSDAPSGSACA